MENPKDEKTLARSLCWHCESDVGGEFFCEQCVKIQPITPEADHFHRLGIPRRLQVDLQELERLFYDRSRQFHPDFFHKKSPQERDISLQNSALLNTAYRTLRDPVRRVEYLIRLEEGAVKDIPAKAPPELLEEVLELQETLETFREKRSAESAAGSEEKKLILDERENLIVREKKVDEELNSLAETWDSLEDSGGGSAGDRKTLLIRMRELLSTRTYLENLIKDIDTAVA